MALVRTDRGRATMLTLGLLLTGCGGPTNTSQATQSTANEQVDATNTQANAPSPQAVPAPVAQQQAPPGQENRCQFKDCPAGSTVITAAKKDGVFLSCATLSLADYTNFVVGLLSMGRSLGTGMPNVNPETGEPEYEGKTKELVESLRSAAGVQTFDEAVARCQYGPYHKHLTVMNYKREQTATWVSDPKTEQSFWVPTSEIDSIVTSKQ